MEIDYFELQLFGVAWIGALCGHMLSLSFAKEYVGTTLFLLKVLPGKSEAFYNRLDALLLPAIGGFLAFMLAGPESPRTSLVCGLTWSGTVTAFVRNRLKANDD